MQHITSILHSLGFVDSEINTYTASLEHGPGTVIDLTKLTKLSRQATYVAIEILTKRGLMSSVLKGKKKYYVSEDPEKLLAYAERKQQEMKEKIGDLSRVLPELKLKARGEHPVVKMFEGKEGIKAILEDIEGSKPKRILGITDFDAVKQILTPEDTQPFKDAIKRNNTKLEYLAIGEPGSASIAHTTKLPAEYPHFNSEILIVDKKIAFITFEGKMNSVIIESDAIAKTLLIVFELALKSLKKI
ncbi:MAG: helix-turn-helix domain-containing protein [bacterium]|nr:helix-turn-helix domain-containing protein [bacterium]